MKRITLVASDLSQNALVRAHLLAEILARDFEVEMVGTQFGETLWAPARSGSIPIHAVPGAPWPAYALRIRELLGRIRGDVVYAMKPLLASFGVALLHRGRSGQPVVLDVDDDELAFRPRATLRRPWGMASSIGHPNGRFWARRMAGHVPSADAVTVASLGLQRRLGGVLVHHAKDTERLRPRPELREAARARLGVAGRRVVTFMGTPRAHKGIEDVAEAMGRMRTDAVFVVAGADPADGYVRALMDRFPAIVFHPPYALEDGPLLLEAADAVVVPQRLSAESVVQMPGKLLEAMAMAKPIVSTALSDIPELLAKGRGHVVPPADPAAIAAALDRIFDSPEEAERMGLRA
ncbi:MAG TPA: glycosyltransferase family 4 protein, partial [Longimicrobium sp.]|nr:glycosyltransferase family 4 protein [Longimicrobium sp.]